MKWYSIFFLLFSLSSVAADLATSNEVKGTTSDEKYGQNSRSLIRQFGNLGVYDVIIVGAGPGGIAAAYTIQERQPDARILMIERGPAQSAYTEKGYGDALRYAEATGDPQFREDVPGTPIVVGTGVGGGTLHFGMQYIDQPEVADASIRQATPEGDLVEEVQLFTSQTQATGYTDQDYTDASVFTNYTNLKNKIEEVMIVNGGKLYNNKVYKTGTGIQNQPRLLLGNLIPESVEVLTDTEVVDLVQGRFGRPNQVVVEGRFLGLLNRRIQGRHIILAAGALNSARLALKAGIALDAMEDENDGRKYLPKLWDHQGMFVTYYPPGTTFFEDTVGDVDPADQHGLTVYTSRDEAAATTDGFVAILFLPALTAEEVNTIQQGNWGAALDPSRPGTVYPYLFDLNNFFRRRHPGLNQEGTIEANNYNLNFVLDNIAPESHKGSTKIGRLERMESTLIGILSQPQTVPSFNTDAATSSLAGDKIIGHLQSRPDDQLWQYYYVSNPGDKTVTGTGTTGEEIGDDGRVYEGDAVDADTVKLPSLSQRGFEELKEAMIVNDQILTELGYTAYGGGSYNFTALFSSIENVEQQPNYLRTTYHYHGALSQTQLPEGFYAGDLSRMKTKWAGSTSVAAAAMGIRAGNEVADELEAEGLQRGFGFLNAFRNFFNRNRQP